MVSIWMCVNYTSYPLFMAHHKPVKDFSRDVFMNPELDGFPEYEQVTFISEFVQLHKKDDGHIITSSQLIYESAVVFCNSFSIPLKLIIGVIGGEVSLFGETLHYFNKYESMIDEKTLFPKDKRVEDLLKHCIGAIDSVRNTEKILKHLRNLDNGN